MKIHLAIFDEKAAGILSAALHLKPDMVILLHRPGALYHGLQSVLQSRGIRCQCEELSFDANQIREAVARLLHAHREDEMLLNASCGYRKMVLLCFEQFFLHDAPVFMVDKFTNTLHWMEPRDGASEIHIRQEMKIHEYLKSFNTHVLEAGQNEPEPAQRRELTHWILRHIERYDNELGTLNYMAMTADSANRYALSRHEQKRHQLMELFERFSEAGVLRVQHNKLIFPDSDNRFYANGGWLENHVYSLIYGMRKNRPQISDLSKGLQVVRAQGKVKNELDVVALCNNRLHVFECKTRKFRKNASEDASEATAVYRLEAIKNLSGGLSAKAMLVSFQPLNKYTRSRAQDFGVYCCAHTQLQQLEHHLYTFFDQDN